MKKKTLLQNLREYKHVIVNKDQILKETDWLRGKNFVLRDQLNNNLLKLFNVYQHHFNLVKQSIKTKIKNGKKVRIAFFIIYDSVFPARPLYEAMLKDKMFEPFIVVIPDTLRGQEHEEHFLKKTYESLSKTYHDVFLSYDQKNKRYIDFSDRADLIYFASPYDNMTHKYYRVEYFLDKNVLPFHINYGYFMSKYSREIMKMPSYNYFWKIFIENNDNYLEQQLFEPLKGENTVVTGYCKMDKLSTVKNKRKHDRKLIIIAPHHTVCKDFSLQLSNFLTYSQFFLELPTIFPQIDFVFRPHPLLFHTLSEDDIWGINKTKQYFNLIDSFPNMKYDTSGDYFNLFNSSDAMIHDCGSFLVEYLFTGKPTCYMLKSKKEIDDVFTPIGKKCLENCYQAFNKQDILNFIKSVILKNNDSLKTRRQQFVENELKVNYPNVSNVIINYLKREFL